VVSFPPKLPPPLEKFGGPRVRVRIGAVVVLTLVALAIAVLVSAFAPRGKSGTVSLGAPDGASTRVPSTSSPAAGHGSVFVHIVGAVAHPGLYELRDGDRVVDVVAAAGGLTSTADEAQLNLARRVSDGEQIIVPEIGATPAAAAGTVGGKVNINTADSTTLETLPRVGPAMAERIIAWRTANGRFGAIEDLMSVTGIGAITFDGFKDLITI
jgi:competence protein ComEA